MRSGTCTCRGKSCDSRCWTRSSPASCDGGKGWSGTRRLEDGVTLRFDDGTSEEAGILVGADGIFSRVRAQKLGDDPLSYLGVLVVLGICRGVDVPLCRNKVFQVVDGENRMYAMPFTASPDGDGCIRPLDEPYEGEDEPGAMMWQLSFPVTEDRARALATDSEALWNEALRRCASWPDPVPRLLNQTRKEDMAGYPAYDRDMTPANVLRGKATSRVTLIGDAAHPMSPFKGQGANQALVDAVQLARCIVRSPQYMLPGRATTRVRVSVREHARGARGGGASDVGSSEGQSGKIARRGQVLALQRSVG